MTSKSLFITMFTIVALSLLVVGKTAGENCLCIDKPNCTAGSHAVDSGNCGGHGQYKYYCCSSKPDSSPSSCGPESPSKVPNCDKPDLGSCGNACCTVQFVRHPATTPDILYEHIKKYLEADGVFASYKYVTGPDAAGHNPSDDLRPYNMSYEFVFQGTHTTSGGYVDTLNFNIERITGGTLVTAFSISNIHGALGDNGQNYKSLFYLLTTSPGLNVDEDAIKIVSGCGQKRS